MSQNHHECTELRVLILAPTSKDAELTASMLGDAGVECHFCKNLDELCLQLTMGVGAIVLPEEAIVQGQADSLNEWLSRQPPWSDLPILVLARPGADSAAVGQSMELLSNVIVLERPMRVASLVSAVRTALRARLKQYQIRDYLLERERSMEVQSLLAAIVASSDDAIISKDLNGVILSWNAGAERIFGYTREEVIGKSITILMPPERQSEEPQLLEQLRRGDRIDHFETVRVTKDGRRLDISLSISPIRDASGKVVGASKVARDITEKKRGEETFRTAAIKTSLAAEANAKFRTLFDQGAMFAGILTPNGTVVETNQLALEFCGFKREDCIGRRFWECGWWSPSPELQEMVETACQLAAAGEVFRTETFYYVADGSRRVVNLIIAPVRDEAGRVLFLNPTGTDITEKYQAEADLRKQTNRLRLLWEAASVLLITDEPDAMMRGLFAKIAPHFGLDCYFNFMHEEGGDALRLESCLGIPEETVQAIHRLELGQAICGAVAQRQEAITATFIQQSDEPWVQIVKSFGIRAYVCNPLMANGRLLGTLSFASRFRDTFDDDEQEFLSTICKYVTVAYERMRLVHELREGDRKKDEFIALLAHELRNPLAPIRNGLQILHRAGDDAGTADRAREMMERQLGHMVRLIDDLLDLSRISRNKLDLRRDRILLSDVVMNAVESAQPAIDAAGHRLSVSLPVEQIYLDADLTRLAQVFSNLLTNSAKYTPSGGNIWLSAERDGDSVAVKVRDDGIGIPEKSLPTIFNMFSQVDRSIERSTGGLGIGLALVKGLTEMHGGSVTAQSEARGSTFIVTLPILPSVQRTKSTLKTPSGNGRLDLRILVVDDNHDGAESLALMLKMLGGEVQLAHDGIEAVEKAEAFRPDVILMDVGMPRLNGFEATRRIRDYDWGKATVIIALTGWGQDSDREVSREAGCDGHLVKPVSLTDLEDTLGQLKAMAHS